MLTIRMKSFYFVYLQCMIRDCMLHNVYWSLLAPNILSCNLFFSGFCTYIDILSLFLYLLKEIRHHCRVVLCFASSTNSYKFEFHVEKGISKSILKNIVFYPDPIIDRLCSFYCILIEG